MEASRTVIIENLQLDLGLTAKDIQKYILEQLAKLEITDAEIIDIDTNYGPMSVAVEL